MDCYGDDVDDADDGDGEKNEKTVGRREFLDHGRVSDLQLPPLFSPLPPTGPPATLPPMFPAGKGREGASLPFPFDKDIGISNGFPFDNDIEISKWKRQRKREQKQKRQWDDENNNDNKIKNTSSCWRR